MNISNIAKQIKLIIFDVDGVLTDGSILYDNNGNELKHFHCHDGLGMKMLMNSGVDIAIITGRGSDAVTLRMKELGIAHVYQHCKNKTIAYEELIQKLNVSDGQVAYVGDDLPDLALIKRVGLGIATANATTQVKEQADHITEKFGGFGAAREACELIMSAQDKLTAEINKFNT